MRGEKFKQATDALSRLGSPPHARGKAVISSISRLTLGITPACAGKSFGIRTKKSPRRDHPRMRGEKQRMIVYGRPYLWITPACAGKSGFWSTKAPEGRDHPRMRGEKSLSVLTSTPYLGSPPHARGKAYKSRYPLRTAGITPACAGKRYNSFGKYKYRRDHPRMRGEKTACSVAPTIFMGSPPHARGKAQQLWIRGVQGGITPACAGKSRRISDPSDRKRDHPRMRGEKLPEPCSFPGCQGSPPHARGKVAGALNIPKTDGITPACAGKSLRDMVDCFGSGITPACAGKSALVDTYFSGNRDHPRMRGEKPNGDKADMGVQGSPPHARGKVSLMKRSMR